MRSLEEIVAANSQAVARHNPEWLSNIWPIGQAVYALPPEEPPPTAKSTITFGVEALLDMARYALGYNFKGLEQGLINVLRAERNALYAERRANRINDESLRRLGGELDLQEVALRQRLRTARQVAEANQAAGDPAP